MSIDPKDLPPDVRAELGISEDGAPLDAVETEDGTVPGVAREGGMIPITELSFENRQSYLESMPEDERQKLIEALPVKVRMRWINEEREHLEQIGQAQKAEHGVEGAELGEAVGEVTTPGSEEPQDRAPDVGKELVAQLVMEKFTAQQEAAKWERVATERAAELDAYYKAFGPLPSATA